MSRYRLLLLAGIALAPLSVAAQVNNSPIQNPWSGGSAIIGVPSLGITTPSGAFSNGLSVNQGWTGPFTDDTKVNPNASVTQGGTTATQLFQNMYGAHGAQEGIQSVITVPDGTTNLQTNVLAAYGRNQNTNVGVGGLVGLYSLMISDANNANTWGINTQMSDSFSNVIGTATGRKIQNEFDFNVYNTGTTVVGLAVNGLARAVPSAAYGFVVYRLAGTPGAPWNIGFNTQDGAATYASVFGTISVVYPGSAEAGQISRWRWWNGSGVASSFDVRVTPSPINSGAELLLTNSSPPGDLALANGNILMETNHTVIYQMGASGHRVQLLNFGTDDSLIIGGGDATDNVGSIFFGSTASSNDYLSVLMGTGGGDVTLQSASGVDANVPLALKGKGTGTLKLGNITRGTAVQVLDPGAAITEMVNITPGISGGHPSLAGSGSTLNISSNVNLAQGSTNFLTALGNTTGNAPQIGASGSDTNIPFIITSKGTGASAYLRFRTGSGDVARMLDCSCTSADNVTVTAAATGSPALISTNAGALNIAPTTGTIFGSAASITVAANEVGFTKMTASDSAPGAAGAKLDVVCGTNAGSAKLIAYAGTSTTPVTVADNIGSGVTGC